MLKERYLMVLTKSFDECEFIVALVRDVLKRITGISPRAYQLTAAKLRHRYAREGKSFLTKALPRLGKALDQGLTYGILGDYIGFSKIPGTKLPKLMGELFATIFQPDGKLLPDPDVKSIESLRTVLYCFYKYQLPYSKEQEHEVLSSFKKTDGELRNYNDVCRHLGSGRGNFLLPDPLEIDACNLGGAGCFSAVCPKANRAIQRILVSARRVLNELFRDFDHKDIYPCHGPGAVSTKETGDAKYYWRGMSQRLIDVFPLDEYFFVSLTDVADNVHVFNNVEFAEIPAKVVLVPKDSRKPRLISEECLANQWIQQGLRAELYDLIERHPLTRYNVHFTDQSPNQIGALKGSLDFQFQWSEELQREVPVKLSVGKYSTLDLKEASDRISCGLIELLFPPQVVEWAMATRSMQTCLPTGEVLELNKFAPMGSALCFPFLALSIWALLRGAGFDEEAKGSFLVYGDDVVVPTAQAEYAITVLESFGLLVNRDKSCFQGFFRESCGVDAFKGHIVTPLRVKKVWTSSRCPDSLDAWCSYENALCSRGYTSASEYISQRLIDVYGCIPAKSANLAVPSIASVPDNYREPKRRFNILYQRWESRVWTSKPRSQDSTLKGWKALLKYFSLKGRPKPYVREGLQKRTEAIRALSGPDRSSVSTYTKRRDNVLSRKWVTEKPLPVDQLDECFTTLVDVDPHILR